MIYASIRWRHRHRWKQMARARHVLREKERCKRTVTFNERVVVVYVPPLTGYDLWWSPTELNFLQDGSQEKD